ncbi:MAG: hypothetical protein JO340_15970 [Acidobacteriaceae bacterium]|nr:hypothetical protein [Acidobacteriaceae bacterium]
MRNDSNFSPAPPGLKLEYNHDLDVSEDFLRAYTLIRKALKDERLIRAFRYYDGEAKKHKRWFESLGIWTLLLALAPLLVAAIRMIVGDEMWKEEISTSAETLGLISVLLVLLSRRRQHRRLWCKAVFCRERLRQWHFQKFLDGEFIGLLVDASDRFDVELDKRWANITHNFRDSYGAMKQFLDFDHDSDSFVKVTPYADRAVAQQVINALSALRVQHQLRYAVQRTADEGEERGLSLEERRSLSEHVAALALAGAVLVIVSALLVPIVSWIAAHGFGHDNWLPKEKILTRYFEGAALFLSVLSAGSRAYRAGFTVPDESESYEEYSNRLREIVAVFDSAPTLLRKMQALKHLEDVATDELRRFLKMKERATFVF